MKTCQEKYTFYSQLLLFSLPAAARFRSRDQACNRVQPTLSKHRFRWPAAASGPTAAGLGLSGLGPRPVRLVTGSTAAASPAVELACRADSWACGPRQLLARLLKRLLMPAEGWLPGVNLAHSRFGLGPAAAADPTVELSCWPGCLASWAGLCRRLVLRVGR